MSTVTSNNIGYNVEKALGQNSRSGHTIILDEKIVNLNNLSLDSKYINTRTNEENKIINTKDASLNIADGVGLRKTNLNNSFTLPKLLVSNKTDNFNTSSFLENSSDKGKIFSIGNKNISLRLFKTLLNTLNTNIKLIEENKDQLTINSLRHYLSALTKFDFKLPNSNYNLYQFNKTNRYLFAMQKASKFLSLSFNSKGCFISKPSFNLIYTNNIENEISNKLNTAKIVINLFYYVKTTELNLKYARVENKNNQVLTEQFEDKFENLTDYLTKLFNTEIELNLVRLYQPYQDSNILVQFLNSESYNNKFIKLISKLFKNINMNENNSDTSSKLNLLGEGSKDNLSYPSNISGVNVKLAGRSLNERVIPRLTVKRAQRGSFNRLNAKLIEKSMFTDKTRKGAFSFTVTLSQNFK